MCIVHEGFSSRNNTSSWSNWQNESIKPQKNKNRHTDERTKYKMVDQTEDQGLERRTDSRRQNDRRDKKQEYNIYYN